MPKSFGRARLEDACAAMNNQWECTLTVLLSQMQSNNIPVSSHGKLVDNFSPKSDVTSLQEPVTSRPYLDT